MMKEGQVQKKKKHKHLTWESVPKAVEGASPMLPWKEALLSALAFLSTRKRQAQVDPPSPASPKLKSCTSLF